ncbi:hypothetical protein JY651_04660 [Pyxidicoccus parkwayensis]|uniref:Uncharacterized protein n=1 Tax=Pyxidicoccus parkwayensis TaxID=2813578 RepID=A0ABX7P1W8_9BACT|nr:hypothetical protein [Pyxidicoccus parkwaysis]QSQ24262.1 hypothetical protein JY651_04660 [Pyxidicoccus parkwaysis]
MSVDLADPFTGATNGLDDFTEQALKQSPAFARQIHLMRDDLVLSAAAEPPTDLMGYHLVTAVTQDTVNFQFKKLFQSGVIHRTLDIADPESGIELHANLDAPLVRFGGDASPHTVLFTLRLKNGTLTYFEGFGPKAQRKQLPFKGWEYAFRVNMNMLQHSRNATGSVVPEEVRRKLEAFSDDLFSIRRLFMDFQSANLADYAPELSKLPLEGGGNASRGVLLQFTQALALYFKSFKNTDNPYILGYSIERKNAAEGPPALFAPSGTTFSCFQDGEQPGLSSLNFLLMTRGQPFPPDPRAGVFPRNWVTSGEYDGRMVIAADQFRKQYVEAELLPRVREALRPVSPSGLPDWSEVNPNVISSLLGQTPGSLAGPAWLTRAILNNLNDDPDPANHGHGVNLVPGAPAGARVFMRRYRSNFCALWQANGPDIVFHGYGAIDDRQEFFHYPFNAETFICKTRTAIFFSFTVRLLAGTDGRLTLQVEFADSKPVKEHNLSKLAEVANFLMGPIVGDLNQQLEQMTQYGLDLQKSLVQGMQASLRATLGEVETRVVLPAGDVFFYKGLTRDSAGNALLDISYKTEHLEGTRHPHPVLQSVTDTASAPARLRSSVSTELMKNYASASVVSAGERFEVAQDARGEPLLFSLSEDRRLFVTRRDAAGPTGWRRDDLSSALGAGMEATAFAVSQDRDGTLTLALAMCPAGKPEDARLYVSPRLSNDDAVTDWSRVGTRWHHRHQTEGPLRITRILMGTGDDGDGAPLALVAVVTRWKEAKHFQFNADAEDTSWSWKPYELPENASELQDLAVGRMQGDRGVYALYMSGRNQTLEFTSMPDPEYGKRARYVFKLPCRASCIAVVPGPDGALSDDLYMGGEGVFLYAGSRSEVSAVASAGDMGTVERLLVRSDADTVAVWTVDASGGLRYTSATRGGREPSWSTPLQLGRGARQLAALRNQARLTNALFVVTSAGTLEYRYQDPRTQRWESSEVPLPDSGRLLEFPCYTSQITLTDEAGTPTALSKVRLSASEWAQVTVNGATHVLDPDREVEVETDTEGRLTLINRVSGLASPTFLVRSEGLEDALRVDPARRVLDTLGRIQTGEDLLRFKSRDGRPLGGGATPKQRDTAAKAVKELVGLAGTLPSGGPNGPGPMLRAASHPTGALRSAAPVAHTWGVVLDGADAGFFHGEQAVATYGRGSTPVGPGMSSALAMDLSTQPMFAAAPVWFPDAGSLLESLQHSARKVRDFLIQVVDGAVRFVVTLGEKVFQVVLHAAEQVYSLVHWVLQETLGVDLNDLVDYFGFLFSWQDIVVTHDVLVNLINQAITKGTQAMGQVAGAIDGFFEDLKKRVRALKPLTSAGDAVRKPGLQAARSAQESLHRDEEAKVEAFSRSPVGNFAGYHLQQALKSGAAGGVSKLPENDPLRATLNDLVEVWETIRGNVEKLGTTLSDGLLKGTLSFNDLITQLSSDVVVGLLDVFKTILVKLIGFGERLVTGAQALINKKVDLPVISALYREYVGSDMSVLDAVCLLLSMPLTTVYKLLKGEAPFPFVDVAPAPRVAGIPGALMAAEAVDPSELSKHPRYEGASKKPRTFGFDTMVGAGIWTALSGAGLVVGAAGYGLLKVLSLFQVTSNAIVKPLYNGIERLKTFLAPLAPLVAPFMVVLKLVVFIGKVIWLTVQAVKSFQPIAGTIRYARWAVSGLAVLAEFISAVDPAEKAGPIVRMIGATLDVLLALPYAIIRIVDHAGGEDKWLIGLDVVEGVGAVVDWVSTLCSGASKLIDEGVTKTVLFAASTGLTVFTTGMTGVTTAVPFFLDLVVEPL